MDELLLKVYWVFDVGGDLVFTLCPLVPSLAHTPAYARKSLVPQPS